MSATTGILLNGEQHSMHDHTLRPRGSLKPTNPDVRRTLSDDGYLGADGAREFAENGGSSGQTR
jgi:hypothetical protein